MQPTFVALSIYMVLDLYYFLSTILETTLFITWHLY
jgi:hypothetical protein